MDVDATGESFEDCDAGNVLDNEVRHNISLAIESPRLFNPILIFPPR